MSAPSRTMRRPCSIAPSMSVPRPSPLNESGVTLTMPITYVREPHSNLWPPISAITARLCSAADMRLDELARGAGAALEGSPDVEVSGIAYDSRRVNPGDLFVAVQGIHVDGHHYLHDAIAKGAVAVAVERPVPVPEGVPLLRLPSTRIGLAELSAELFGRPSRQLRLAGVTGTDGKTTVTHMAEHVLQAGGVVAGAMSTVAFKVSGREVDNVSGQTTTEAPEVQAWLARMVEAGAQAAVIETTSHALVQERVRACEFDVAAFTNVGHDHLDYHATWEDYLEAKGRLIELTANAADKGIEKTAVLNRDDASYERLARKPISRRWTYGLTTASDLHPLELSITGIGSRFRMKTPFGETEVILHVPARFNIYNALCAAGVCLALGVPIEDVGQGLAGFEGVRGRLEPRPAGHGPRGGGVLRLLHHHHRRPAERGPGRDRARRADGRRRQVARARLRGRDRPPRRHPPCDRDRRSRGHRAPGGQGARALDANRVGLGTLGRARGAEAALQGRVGGWPLR